MQSQFYRDLAGWKYAGLPLSTSSNEAAKLYDSIITQYTQWCDDPSVGGLESSMKQILQADPDFVMGHVICTGLELLSTGTTVRTNPDMKNRVEQMVTLATKNEITDRERKHVQAVKLLSDDNLTGATDIWEDILVDHPMDMLALKMLYHTYFFLGDSVRMRDCIARALPLWNKEIPLYNYLYGMYAFGLVETNLYKDAEKNALKGLELNPRDCYSTHAQAHVLEMEGRSTEGVKFFEQTENDWKKGTMFACHNYWHWAVFHIEKGEYETALDIHDKEVFSRCQPGAILNLNDSSSLLYRLNMEGFSAGPERWNNICSLYTQHFDDHVLVFNDIHALMATLGAHNDQSTSDLMNSLRNCISKKTGSNGRLYKEVGLPMCEAFEAFEKEDFDEAVELLYPLRYRIVEIGGSNAQRDVFHQMLVHATLQSSQPKHHKMARLLLAERKSLKENSPTYRQIGRTNADNS